MITWNDLPIFFEFDCIDIIGSVINTICYIEKSRTQYEGCNYSLILNDRNKLLESTMWTILNLGQINFPHEDPEDLYEY